MATASGFHLDLSYQLLRNEVFHTEGWLSARSNSAQSINWLLSSPCWTPHSKLRTVVVRPCSGEGEGSGKEKSQRSFLGTRIIRPFRLRPRVPAHRGTLLNKGFTMCNTTSWTWECKTPRRKTRGSGYCIRGREKTRKATNLFLILQLRNSSTRVSQV